jgi:hypothetical protein
MDIRHRATLNRAMDAWRHAGGLGPPRGIGLQPRAILYLMRPLLNARLKEIPRK